MNVNLVADVGNSRIKWGVCARGEGGPTVVRRASLADDPAAWDAQVARWNLGGPLTWAVAGVHPERCGRLREWIVARGGRAVMIDRYDQLPLHVGVDEPSRVGLDRLLNAVAAQGKLAPGKPAILMDMGSAVTVDWLDEEHAFRGGAIFPGFRLMARALHEYTAQLPEITVDPPAPPLPGRSTVPAMRAGVFWAVLGGTEAIARRLRPSSPQAPHVFLTGGDAEWVVAALEGNDPLPWLEGFAKTVWPEQTLVGALLSAEALPS